VADLLFGVANPSGHLAETIPLRLEDTPSYLNFPGEQGVVRYGEGVMVGYRHFTTVGRQVRYPFGHGLSYTTFATSDLRVDGTGPDTATVTLTVTNTGTRAGKHVVQVYVATGAGPVRRPARELRAFTKLALAPGKSREVALRLDRRAFAYYDVREGGWVVAPGRYCVQIGASAAEVVAEAALTLTGDDVVPPLTLGSGVAEWFAHPVVGPVLAERMRQWRPGPDGGGAEDPALLQMVASMPMRRFVSDMGVVAPAGALEELLALAERARSARADPARAR
jgi:beta-glucosidase